MKQDITFKNFEDNEEAFLLQHIIKYTNRSVFLTGKAGSGKSTLVNLIVDNANKKTVKLASTGIAAKNIGGQTIHSLFQIPSGVHFYDSEIIKGIKYNDNKKEFLKSVDLFIIDEVSMVSSYLLDCIDYLLKYITGSFKRFGGKQVLLIADPFQLSPILKNEDKFRVKGCYPSQHFFDANSYKNNHFIMIELKKCYRQNDLFFMDILDSIKTNNITQSKLNEFNAICHKKNNSDGIILAPHNSTVENINICKLEKLSGASYIYTATTQGYFNMNDCLASTHLELKIGAKVMFIKNNFEIGFSNGTLGTVQSLEENKIIVITDEGVEIDVPKIEWKNQKYNDDGDFETIGTLFQYPILLAWAVTIHKSQGLTLPKLHFDISKGVFTHGQVYVALSRCASTNLLSISRPIRQQDIIVDNEVLKFYSQITSEAQRELLLTTLDELCSLELD